MPALAFNAHTESNAWFKYYKRVIGTPYNYNLVDVEADGSWSGGGPDWLHNGCSCGATDCDSLILPPNAYFDYPRGVELDWLRFYWDFRTDPPPAQPSHYAIFDHWAATYSASSPPRFPYAVHDALESQLPVVFASRWDSLADASGADASPE